MGSGHSSLQLSWAVLAALCGVLFLIFDATRHFIHQLSPVRLRRLTGDLDEPEHRRWARYDPYDFQLVSGALLQLALIGAFGSTVMLFKDLPLGRAILVSYALWAGIVILWKFILALIPDAAAEMALRVFIPVSHFFF
jgi:hypothetical protein